MFQKAFSKSSKPKKADSKVLTRDISSNNNGSVEEQMMLKEMYDESWKLTICSQGFDHNVADLYTNLSTGNANLDNFNLHERAYINEDSTLTLSLFNVCKVVECRTHSLTEKDLLLIETAFKTCTPGWISGFYGYNTYRDPINIAKIPQYNGGPLLCKLIERLLNNTIISHSTIDQVINATERLTSAMIRSFEKGIWNNHEWHSLDFNPDVIESILSHKDMLRLFSSMLYDISSIISWKTRENVAKIIVIILSYQKNEMSGLDHMFNIVGDAHFSFFLNQALDFVHAWVPIYLEAKRRTFVEQGTTFLRANKRKHNDEDDMDIDDDLLPATKKIKNFEFGNQGTTKKRQFKPLAQLKRTIVDHTSKFTNSIKGSVRQVRKLQTTEIDFNERVISTEWQTKELKDAHFIEKFDDFFVIFVIHLVCIFAFSGFVFKFAIWYRDTRYIRDEAGRFYWIDFTLSNNASTSFYYFIL